MMLYGDAFFVGVRINVCLSLHSCPLSIENLSSLHIGYKIIDE